MNVLLATMLMVAVDDGAHQRLSKLQPVDFTVYKGADFTLNMGGDATERDIDTCPNLKGKISSMSVAGSLRHAKQVRKGFSPKNLRMKIEFKQGDSVLIDQAGYFTYRNSNKKEIAYFELDRMDYMNLAVEWHDACQKKASGSGNK